jgi:hypothetical protein
MPPNEHPLAKANTQNPMSRNTIVHDMLTAFFLCSRQASTKRTMLKNARTGHDFAVATFKSTGVGVGKLCCNTS